MMTEENFGQATQVSCPECNGSGFASGNRDDLNAPKCTACEGTRCVLNPKQDYEKKYFDLLAEVDKAWSAFPDGTHAPTLVEGIEDLAKKLDK